jgi:DNA-binding response OmpR family regulator
VELPPKEFEILMELALDAGAPLTSLELIKKLWPASTAMTVDDLHSILKASIVDWRPGPQPLVGNRCGFGYVLNAGLRIEQH